MTISMLSRILVLATVVLILGVLWLAVSISHGQRISAQQAENRGVLPVALMAPPKPVASMIRVAYPPPASTGQDAAGMPQQRDASPQQAALLQQPPAAVATPSAVQPAMAIGGPSSSGQGDAATPPASDAIAPPRSILPTRVSATDQAVETGAQSAAQSPSAQPGEARQTDPDGKQASLGADAAGGAAAPATEGDAGGTVDINSASVEALNHLKGGGSIGFTIARHRPYHSIEDLLTKRVLRRSVFEQIKSQISSR